MTVETNTRRKNHSINHPTCFNVSEPTVLPRYLGLAFSVMYANAEAWMQLLTDVHEYIVSSCIYDNKMS